MHCNLQCTLFAFCWLCCFSLHVQGDSVLALSASCVVELLVMLSPTKISSCIRRTQSEAVWASCSVVNQDCMQVRWRRLMLSALAKVRTAISLVVGWTPTLPPCSRINCPTTLIPVIYKLVRCSALALNQPSFPVCQMLTKLFQCRAVRPETVCIHLLHSIPAVLDTTTQAFMKHVVRPRLAICTSNSCNNNSNIETCWPGI